jgi:hypothetical protein
MEILCFTNILVVVMAALAGSPLLLADRAQRRRHRFTQMQRN